MKIKTPQTMTQAYWLRRVGLADAIIRDLSRIGEARFAIAGASQFEGWVSGGLKDHWPTALKNRIRRLSRYCAACERKAMFWRPKYQRMTKFYALLNKSAQGARDDVLLANLNSHKIHRGI